MATTVRTPLQFNEAANLGCSLHDLHKLVAVKVGIINLHIRRTALHPLKHMLIPCMFVSGSDVNHLGYKSGEVLFALLGDPPEM